jgi:hypothetical protein
VKDRLVWLAAVPARIPTQLSKYGRGNTYNSTPVGLLKKVCERGIVCRQSQVVLFGCIRKHRIYQGNIMSPPLTHQHSVSRVTQALVFPNKDHCRNSELNLAMLLCFKFFDRCLILAEHIIRNVYERNVGGLDNPWPEQGTLLTKFRYNRHRG